MNIKFIFLLCAVVLVSGCRPDEPAEPAGQPQSTPAPAVAASAEKDCLSCHRSIRQDAQHELECTACHNGNPAAAGQIEAHEGLIARPAHPRYMQEVCGRCHEKTVQEFQSSLHLTLHQEINLFRQHFGAEETVADLTGIPAEPDPETRQGLADDLLRRLCLRCHLYTNGDDYPLTHRGTGCAACHMEFENGRPKTHEITSTPTDRQCLSCHYGNVVGADYYGRYEHDFNWEYRTPYITRDEHFRPYGVEYHDLAPDVHQQRGMVCIDCHSRHQLMTGSVPPLTCSTCHRLDTNGDLPLPARVARENSALVLTGSRSGKKHIIPQPVHPAHSQYVNKVACQVCHAQWSFNDSTTHLLRSDSDDYVMWERLTVQSSSEIEQLLERNLQNFMDARPPMMRDGLTGQLKPGAWFKGFTRRRWEEIPVHRDIDGKIKIFRPILDLRLSYIDSDWEVVFDNLTGSGPAMRPYTPHTTGRAGMFYRNRFNHLPDSLPGKNSQ